MRNKKRTENNCGGQWTPIWPRKHTIDTLLELLSTRTARQKNDWHVCGHSPTTLILTWDGHLPGNDWHHWCCSRSFWLRSHQWWAPALHAATHVSDPATVRASAPHTHSVHRGRLAHHPWPAGPQQVGLESSQVCCKDPRRWSVTHEKKEADKQVES